MADPSSVLQEGAEGQINNLSSVGNASSSKGSFRIKKINGCLERSDDRPVLIIQPEQISEDVEYWGKHALICKFLGLRLSLPVLESWAHRIWNPEGDMEILLAANNYFMVSFSSMSDRNKVFEGGPYFFNQVGLFIKPWHIGFNSAEEIPSRVPVWVRLPRLPLEFWREDILHSISLLLGKPVGSATQTQDRKVISYARICVEVDLNNPLPDSMEICLGSSSWIQQLDYETLPFRCRICREYGHLLRKCPRNKLPQSSTTTVPTPKDDKGKAHMPEGPSLDKEGFIPVKTRNKGKGQKRTWTDRQSDGTFNRFNVLENLVQEEGIPVEISPGDGSFSGPQLEEDGILVQVPEKEQGQPVGLDGLVQEISCDIPGGSHPCDTPNYITSTHPGKKGLPENTKGSKAASTLGLQQKPFKKGTLEKSAKSGRKTDQEKVKMMGETLVEAGFVKPIDSHFSQSSK